VNSHPAFSNFPEIKATKNEMNAKQVTFYNFTETKGICSSEAP
jgi:hypothetical protein